MLQQYKKDQGRLVRMAAFWLCVLLALFAATTLHGFLMQWDSLSSGAQAPIVGVKLNAAFAICTLLFLAGVYFLFRWQQAPKTADVLIETEAELRRVSWPTLQEVTDSSIVVVVTVLILMGFLAFADWFFARLVGVILG